uniref:GST_C_6 domain-containing protein n=1 Tax=Steinernema glaseri TaxID=37863 RepID=A0A1I7ZVZ3_9BILA
MTNYFMRDMVNDALQTNVNDADWSNVLLITPYQNDQSLLYEYADCIAVRAYLKMISLPFRVDQRPNAEFMSPSGTVPFLKVDEHLVADFQPIVDLVAKKGLKLSATLTDSQLIDMYAHMALIEETLKFVEMHICWFDKATYDQVTKQRYGMVYLWPLRHVLPPLKRREIYNYLDGMQWLDKTPGQLMDAADRVFRSLSVMLGSKDYFMGSQPTELDALAFGHLYTILTTELPNMDLAELVRKHDNLVKFCKKIDHEFFTKK